MFYSQSSQAICACGAVVMLLCIPAWVAGQVSTATLTGIVSDPTEARLPGVRIEVNHLQTGVATATTSNAAGEYSLPLLPPGQYQLTAAAPGFRSMTQSGIVLESGRVTRLDISLELGEVTETVEVVGAVPLIESETSTVGQFIENKTVTDMPLNGRRVGQLLGMMGHSVLIGGDVIRPRVAVAGGRGDSQQWMLDGVNATNLPLGVPQALFNPPVEATQEIRIQQNNYSAEYGNSSGGVIAITTKSGTNEFHGNLYEFIRNDKLDARNFFAADKAPLRWNVYGVGVGGPIIRNRTFFFTHNEWQRQRIGITRVLTVPTPLERAGDFSQTTNAGGNLTRIFDPGTTRADPNNPSRTIRDQFPNNMIPASTRDPVGVELSGFYPLPNRAPSNRAGANNFVNNHTNALNLTTWTTKIDHIFSDADRFSFRFVLHDFPTNTTPVFSEEAADPFGLETDRRAYSWVFNHVHTFSPTLINDLRWNWQPRRFFRLALGRDGNWPQQLGLAGVDGSPFPRVTAAGFTAMGNNNQHRIQDPINDTHIVNNMSWFRSKHSLKIGGEIRLARNVDDLRRWWSGNLAFNRQPTGLPGTGNTGNAIASMLVGFPNRGQVEVADLLDRRAKYFSAYVQDDWRVNSRLTLNFGLRWETHTPRYDANDWQSNFQRTGVNPVSGTPGIIIFAGGDGVGRNVYEGDYNNFGPRFGIAWKPFGGGKTVIRTGFGIFFGHSEPGGPNNLAAGFSLAGDFNTPDNGITAPFLLSEGFPVVEREPLGPGFGAVPAGQRARFSPHFIEPERQLGYSEMINFSIQRDLGWNTLLELSYVGNLGHKLAGPNISINQVRPELMGPGNAQARRPFPQYGNITSQRPMWGNSNYHGFNAKFEKRFSDGLNFLANYTWSKFIDDVPARVEGGDVSGGLQNLYNRRAERGLSGNDVRHRFVWSSVYEIPIGSGRKWLSQGVASKVLGGWNFGVIATLQAGFPMRLTTQVNTTNAFTPGPQRVNVLRDPTLPNSERTVERYFDTTAVEAPAPFTFGNAGRALLTGPGMANFDVSLLKNHRWGERFNVQFRFEAFNFFNRANFDSPGLALGAQNFGVINNARDARSLQFGLKFEF